MYVYILYIYKYCLLKLLVKGFGYVADYAPCRGKVVLGSLIL